MTPSPPSPASSSTPAPAASSSRSTMRKSIKSQPTPKNFASLPRELLAHIAYNVVVDERGNVGSPSALLPLYLTSKIIYDAVCFDNNPQLYHSLFCATFDTAALNRRYQWMKANVAKAPGGAKRKTFDLFADPRSWAFDYRTRWEMSWRLRQVAKVVTIDVPGVCDRDAFVADLWNIWFLLTENDGKNIAWIDRNFDLRACLTAYYRDNLLKESLVPGYPRDTGDKALAAWCSLLAGMDDIGEDTPSDVDEKIFMLRPYVFACAKYDVTYAPWHHRRLPFCPPNCTEHEPDVSIRSKALTYKRFGYTWKRSPPHFILGIFLLFLRLLERQPERVGLKSGSSTFSQTHFNAGSPGLFSTNRMIPSIEHDREWQRNSMCQDPHTSHGLPPLAFRGLIEGFWRGKFLFYDFELYRQILAGNMRGVYTGTFAEQAVEMELKETVIKLPKDKVGGDGSLLLAGYDDEGEDLEEEQRRIKAGYGHELSGDEEVVPEGWTKEILLTGKCRTAWGWAKIRGRVRAWDGLVIFDMTYSRHVMGRWLWRGYIHTGGYLVGRWRDTFTAENLRGYEGAFGMIRAGDPLYPPHFPTRLEDSLGVNQSGPPGPPAPGPGPGGAPSSDGNTAASPVPAPSLGPPSSATGSSPGPGSGGGRPNGDGSGHGRNGTNGNGSRPHA
ncbi:hypothetical protein I316_06056 [Kwoniella heveanensis BCC8398]|uniref:F-box domain-containing protein n=1 Tax=Kwoniella heveanensis BCC8398 TaxID=1296120 RepID=A0A1B9GMY2_9TREE|nr:hypothetical protein I316_06056 [Kwoniella heveanensis BCC8398]